MAFNAFPVGGFESAQPLLFSVYTYYGRLAHALLFDPCLLYLSFYRLLSFVYIFAVSILLPLSQPPLPFGLNTNNIRPTVKQFTYILI